MPASVAARHFHGSDRTTRPGTPVSAAGRAQGGLITMQALAVVVISVSLVLFAYGESVLAHFVGSA